MEIRKHSWRQILLHDHDLHKMLALTLLLPVAYLGISNISPNPRLAANKLVREQTVYLAPNTIGFGRKQELPGGGAIHSDLWILSLNSGVRHLEHTYVVYGKDQT